MEDFTSLVERAIDQDVNAYSQLVERFQDMAVGYGYALSGDWPLAQDAAQEAFLEAYINLSRLYAPVAFPGLLRKLIFKHYDRLTRRGRGFYVLPIETALEQASSEPGPDEMVEMRETRQIVQDAVQALPEPERMVISLYYMSGYKQQEIATFLDLPITTVNTRLYTARKRLKERLLDMVEQDMNESRPSQNKQFVESVLRIIAPDQDKDAERIYTLIDRLHSQGLAEQAQLGRIAESHYDWHTSRIGLQDNEIVTHIGVYNLLMRIGTARIRVAGINLDIWEDQATSSSFEKTMADTLKAMDASGYNLSVVRSGSMKMYTPHGYVYAMPTEYTYIVKTEDLPDAPPDVRLEEIFYNDVHSRADIIELYNREFENVTMTAVRPT